MVANIWVSSAVAGTSLSCQGGSGLRPRFDNMLPKWGPTQVWALHGSHYVITVYVPSSQVDGWFNSFYVEVPQWKWCSSGALFHLVKSNCKQDAIGYNSMFISYYFQKDRQNKCRMGWTRMDSNPRVHRTSGEVAHLEKASATFWDLISSLFPNPLWFRGKAEPH